MTRGPKPYPWETATHCRRGHPLTGEHARNLIRRPGRGFSCRACGLETGKLVRKRTKERRESAWRRLNSPKTYNKLEKEVGSSNAKTAEMLDLMLKIENALPYEKPELERKFEELQRSNG